MRVEYVYAFKLSQISVYKNIYRYLKNNKWFLYGWRWRHMTCCPQLTLLHMNICLCWHTPPSYLLQQWWHGPTPRWNGHWLYTGLCALHAPSTPDTQIQPRSLLEGIFWERQSAGFSKRAGVKLKRIKTFWPQGHQLPLRDYAVQCAYRNRLLYSKWK